MLKEILLPDLGEGIDSADVSEILVSPGDTVSVDDTILVLESDKASMEIPTENAGIIKKVFVAVGDEVKTGEVLIVMEATSEKKLKQKKEVKEVKEVKEKIEPKKQKTKNKAKDKTFASPGVRKLSRELEINLSQIKATGPKGRITKEDLHGFIKQKMTQGGFGGPQTTPKIDFSKWGNVEDKPLTKIQRITGDRLQRAWQTIPHVTQFDEANISILNTKREELKK